MSVLMHLTGLKSCSKSAVQGAREGPTGVPRRLHTRARGGGGGGGGGVSHNAEASVAKALAGRSKAQALL